jgi:predicted acetyltransferase
MISRFNGFLQPVPPADRLGAIAASWQCEGRTLHAIYDLNPRPDIALGAEIPVATMATFGAGLDAGGPAGIPCTLIADVTVRPTHQGWGLMRRLMQAVTTDASDAGVPLMGLHAAHPALYARFGFAPAIRSMSVELDCSRFSLRSRPAGTVHEADPRRADDMARIVAASSGPFGFGALGLTDPPAGHTPWDVGDGDRCLIHADECGNIDGVLTYAFQGWTPQAQVLEIHSETYSTTNAHAALWQTVASTGIATAVSATDVRLDDPLPWMLTDRAALRVTGLTDGLSLRILDPARALELRGYTNFDSGLAIEVIDQTGTAAGKWFVRVSDGHAEVDTTSRPADVTLDAKELAAIFLGSTRTITLLEAGLVTASRAAAHALDALLRRPVEASSSLHF